MTHRTQVRRCPGLVRGLVPLVFLLAAGATPAQPPDQKPPPKVEAPEPPAPKIEVDPVSEDKDIGERLTRILRATGWFTDPVVRVDEGVVFLGGRTETEQHRKWAGDLARNTQDVVAVVNQIEVAEPPVWDFSPALAGLDSLSRDLVRGLPWVVFTLIVLAVALIAARLTSGAARWFLAFRIRNRLLRAVLARATGIIVFLVGLYIVLQVAGLTRLALTVVGGTGVLGIILGIAFRDISENFLASLFLSVQNPFRTGDLVEVAGVLGYIQRTTIRSTVLMTLDGNHVQVPNSTVYKSVVRNFTSNPNRREDFDVGIGFDVPTIAAQEVALRVLAEHPAVLRDPEPWVLVHSIGKSTINLRIYFWLDGSKHSWLKVRSSVIRLVKRAFQENGIPMPDEAREVIFPHGVPLRLLREAPSARADGPPAPRPEGQREENADPVTPAEGGLASEAGLIRDQARRAQLPDEGGNLLEKTAPNGGA